MMFRPYIQRLSAGGIIINFNDISLNPTSSDATGWYMPETSLKNWIMALSAKAVEYTDWSCAEG